MTGDELREVRLGLGLSQEGLAGKVGAHRNTVARWERGELSISEPVARLLCLLYVSARREGARARAPRRRGTARAGTARGPDAAERAAQQAVRDLTRLLGVGALSWYER
jgi:transcriptional regulator with XRE-family HTH domain